MAAVWARGGREVSSSGFEVSVTQDSSCLESAPSAAPVVNNTALYT